MEERRAARKDMRSSDRAAKERWVTAKQRAASVERRVSQSHFRDFVSNNLNKHQQLGRVHKTLKKWEGATHDVHRSGETIEDGGRTLTTDCEKATAFNRTYAAVSRQVRNRKVDRAVKARLRAPNVRTCRECRGDRSGTANPSRRKSSPAGSSKRNFRRHRDQTNCATSISSTWDRVAGRRS